MNPDFVWTIGAMGRFWKEDKARQRRGWSGLAELVAVEPSTRTCFWSHGGRLYRRHMRASQVCGEPGPSVPVVVPREGWATVTAKRGVSAAVPAVRSPAQDVVDEGSDDVVEASARDSDDEDSSHGEQADGGGRHACEDKTRWTCSEI